MNDSTSKCFQNIYIKRKILYYLSLYNLNFTEIKFEYLESLKQYKYKSYLNSIHLYLNVSDPLLNEINEIIPSDICEIKIELVNYGDQVEFYSLLDCSKFKSIQSLKIINSTNYCIYNIKKYIGSLPSSVNSLVVMNNGYLFLNEKNQLEIPNDFFKSSTSLTTLELPFSIYDPRKTPNLLNVSLFQHGNLLSQLPNSVTNLSIHYNSNDIQPNDLPKNLLKLSLPNDFNQPIRPSILPSTLKSLTFNYMFNQPVSNGWLKSLNNLTYLKFGAKFNQSIPNGALSTNLKTLIFGADFRKPLGSKTNLPQALIELELPKHYSLDMISSFPNSIEIFTYMGLHRHSNGSPDLPSNLIQLTCSQYSTFNSFPNTIKTLTFVNTTPPIQREIFSPFIPPTIETINFISFDKPFNNNYFNYDQLTNLKSIHFDDTFNKAIGDHILTLLTSLTRVKMGKQFNHPITKFTFPNSLKQLELGLHFNQSISNLPSSLLSLHIDYGLNIKITENNQVLGKNLKILSIGDYRYDINFKNLPPSLKSLIVNGTNTNFINSINNLDDEYLNIITIRNLKQ